MSIPETPITIILAYISFMITPFVMLESTLIAVIATLRSFRAAATSLSFWCKRGFGIMIGKYDGIYKKYVRGVTAWFQQYIGFLAES